MTDVGDGRGLSGTVVVEIPCAYNVECKDTNKLKAKNGVDMGVNFM